MIMYKVSIIVPCYNVEKFLPRCIDSLLCQTLIDIEIILVDDGSPDRCPQMCDEYAIRDARVKVVHKQNGGLGFARNCGLEIASGEYIGFVDSDDFVEHEMFETLYDEATKSNADVVFCNFLTESSQGTWHLNQEVCKRKEWLDEKVKNFMLDMVASEPHISSERQFQMSVWHSIYRKEIIDKYNIRFYSEREVNSEDFPFQMDFLLRSKKVVFIPQAFYHYCSNGVSLTHTFNPDKFRRIRNLYNLMCFQLHDLNGAQERLDRFYIGYVRSRIQDMVLAHYKDSKKILGNIMDDSIFNDINNRFPINKLPFYPKIVHYMILRKHKMALIIFMKLVLVIKSMSHKSLFSINSFKFRTGLHTYFTLTYVCYEICKYLR